MHDYQDYETKHSYQKNDLSEDPDAIDPVAEEADGTPVRASGLPPEDYLDQLDDYELDEDEELVHVAQEVSEKE